LRILITGVSGFAGSHLADHLLSEPEADVWGCDRGATRRLKLTPGLKSLTADLLDPESARAVIHKVQPERIYHLAGQAHVGESWANPWTTLEVNLRAQVNVFEAVLAEGLKPRLLVLGSMEEYGQVAPDELPVREASPLRPDSPYGVSKVGQDLLGLQYHLSRGLAVVRVRPFNHIGPRQSLKFVAPAFASQIAAIEAGRQPPLLKVGNLGARRDFTDVRDMVGAYRLALEHCDPGEVYNIGSGRSRAIQELLDTLLSLARCPIRVELDPARLRPSDVPNVVCDASRFKARTGWEPRIPFEQSLQDLLEYERNKLAEDERQTTNAEGS
jgi:GDP-4-dehydro-6-deoxy-D-mannose reductase